MLFDIQYNPTAKDIVITNLNDLSFITGTDVVIQACILRIIIPKGSFIFNPALGSNLYTLEKGKAVGDITPIVNDIIQEALQPEIDAGNISDILDVNTSYDTEDRTKLKVFVSILISNSVVDINLTT